MELDDNQQPIGHNIPSKIKLELVTTEPKEKKTDLFSLILALIKTLVWPIVILTIYLQVKDPILHTFQQIPGALSQSQKLSVGTLSFEIERSLETDGDQELKDRIRGLSYDEFVELHRLYRRGRCWVVFSFDRKRFFLPGQQQIELWSKLSDRGLVTFPIPLYEFWGRLNVLPIKQKIEIESGYEYILKIRATDAEVRTVDTQCTDISEPGERVVLITVSFLFKQLINNESAPEINTGSTVSAHNRLP